LLYLIRLIRLIRGSRKREIYLHDIFHIQRKIKTTIIEKKEDISEEILFNDCKCDERPR